MMWTRSVRVAHGEVDVNDPALAERRREWLRQGLGEHRVDALEAVVTSEDSVAHGERRERRTTGVGSERSGGCVREDHGRVAAVVWAAVGRPSGGVSRYSGRMPPIMPVEISLRRTTAADVPLLHAFELDRASNELAGTKPRDWSTFLTRWEEILADDDGRATGVTPRVIVADGAVVGAVNISPSEGSDSIGYWIAREHWGRGIATRAVALMLREFQRRPLFATAAGHNQPSIRVLEKNGFEVVSRRRTAATSRTVERETVVLALR